MAIATYSLETCVTALPQKDAGNPGMCYVGFLPCGCPVAAVSCALSRRDLAKEIAKMVRAGYRVEPKPSQWVRDGNLTFCVHQSRPAKQESLAL
jgi:hypothetical protein